MKKIFLLSLITLLFVSCEQDESLDPRPLIVEGEYVKLDVKNSEKFIDVTNKTTSAFKGLLTSPSGKIVKYELFIRRVNSLGNLTGDFQLFKTITSFPYQLEIKAQDIADFYNIPFDDVKQSEVYQFLAYSYDANGNKFGYSSLSRTVRTTASMKQGYKFKTTIDLPNETNYLNFNIYAPF